GQMAHWHQWQCCRTDVAVRRFIGNGGGACGHRLVDMLTTIMAQTGHGQKQVARLHLAAVGSQAGDGHWLALPLGEQRVKLDHPRSSMLSGPGSSACCSSARLSGAILSSRSALDISPLNTGAATRPP